MSAAESVWSLVSGLPRGLRERRKFMVLQAYVDDSGSDPNKPIFVLAGFVADSEQWAALSSDWVDARDKPPGLDYFKMSEAAAMVEQFSPGRGWTERLRDERVSMFDEIIGRHAQLRISTSISNREFNEKIRPIPAVERSLGTDSAFLHLATRLFGMMVNQGARGVVPEPCRFIFDTQEGYTEEFARNWLVFKGFCERSNCGQWVAEPPIFENDKKFMGLQAADLYAWHVRHHVERGLSINSLGNTGLKHVRKLPLVKHDYHTAELNRLRDQLLDQGRWLSKEKPDLALFPFDKALRKAATRRRKRAKAFLGSEVVE